MKFEELLHEIGEFGPYQRRVVYLIAIPTILGAMEAVSVVFTFNIPSHRCALPDFPHDQYRTINDTHASMLNRSIPYDSELNQWSECYLHKDLNYDVNNISSLVDVNGTGNGSITATYASHAAMGSNRTECSRWVFDDSVFDSTIATDFEIVCDRTFLRSSSNMIAEFGCLFGTLLCGFVADRFGRKLPFYIGSLAVFAGGIAIAFTQDFISLNVCRFIVGMGRMSIWINSLVVASEIVGPSKRVFVGILMEFAWCVGMFLLLIFVYLIRQWRYLEIALSLPALIIIPYWWLIPESPRWLASQGRGKDVKKIMEKIAKSNKTKLPEIDDITEVVLKTGKNLSFKYIFTSWELIKRMVIIFSNMFMLCIIYYALIFNITNLAGNIFLNFMIGTIVETCGYMVPFFLLDRIGRKCLYCASILISGFACILCVVPDILGAPDWVVVALSMAGRFCSCSGYGVIYIYGTELFPTVIRGSAMGIGVTFSRVGGILAPYMADLGILVGGSLRDALPMLVMGVPAVIVGFMALWLPETMGTKLPETLEDVNDLKGDTGCYCCRKMEPDVTEITVTAEGEEMLTSPC